MIGFVGMTVLSFIPCLGQILLPVAAAALGCLLMFALILIVDRDMAFWPASMASMNMVKDAFWPFLGFFAVASILGSIGAILCGIGMIVTMPITYCMLVVAYRAVTSQIDHPPPAQAEPAPVEPPVSEPPPAEPPAAEPPTPQAAG